MKDESLGLTDYPEFVKMFIKTNIWRLIDRLENEFSTYIVN